jgi:hypothetical protein
MAVTQSVGIVRLRTQAMEFSLVLLDGIRDSHRCLVGVNVGIGPLGHNCLTSSAVS